MFSQLFSIPTSESTAINPPRLTLFGRVIYKLRKAFKRSTIEETGVNSLGQKEQDVLPVPNYQLQAQSHQEVNLLVQEDVPQAPPTHVAAEDPVSAGSPSPPASWTGDEIPTPSPSLTPSTTVSASSYIRPPQVTRELEAANKRIVELEALIAKLSLLPPAQLGARHRRLLHLAHCLRGSPPAQLRQPPHQPSARPISSAAASIYSPQVTTDLEAANKKIVELEALIAKRRLEHAAYVNKIEKMNLPRAIKIATEDRDLFRARLEPAEKEFARKAAEHEAMGQEWHKEYERRLILQLTMLGAKRGLEDEAKRYAELETKFLEDNIPCLWDLSSFTSVIELGLTNGIHLRYTELILFLRRSSNLQTLHLINVKFVGGAPQVVKETVGLPHVTELVLAELIEPIGLGHLYASLDTSSVDARKVAKRSAVGTKKAFRRGTNRKRWPSPSKRRHAWLLGRFITERARAALGMDRYRKRSRSSARSTVVAQLELTLLGAKNEIEESAKRRFKEPSTLGNPRLKIKGSLDSDLTPLPSSYPSPSDCP
ncbi:hypothetical protein M407DRAFT_4831 [Tulasnella calospora MUT 4182]|uniref:Uncharacterized protein n=1 Tax=Tulasnella calospora MUT 4182 TaxID=1051891 RepID=A0A0C3LDE0_9AGAM|nr:hypothetical protein M407DRAFT_4831 [Tulasnella calospora MUT 4182]